jgi:hypothetical protein
MMRCQLSLNRHPLGVEKLDPKEEKIWENPMHHSVWTNDQVCERITECRLENHGIRRDRRVTAGSRLWCDLPPCLVVVQVQSVAITHLPPKDVSGPACTARSTLITLSG